MRELRHPIVLAAAAALLAVALLAASDALELKAPWSGVSLAASAMSLVLAGYLLRRALKIVALSLALAADWFCWRLTLASDAGMLSRWTAEAATQRAASPQEAQRCSSSSPCSSWPASVDSSAERWHAGEPALGRERAVPLASAPRRERHSRRQPKDDRYCGPRRARAIISSGLLDEGGGHRGPCGTATHERRVARVAPIDALNG